MFFFLLKLPRYLLIIRNTINRSGRRMDKSSIYIERKIQVLLKILAYREKKS